MKLETKAAAAALAAGLFVVGASYAVSGSVTAQGAGGGARGGAAAHAPAPKTVQAAGLGAAQMVVQGHSLFAQACASCHGASGQGGYGPNLHGIGLPDTRVAAVIKNGIAGKMPAYGDKYSAPQQQSLVAYVQSLK